MCVSRHKRALSVHLEPEELSLLFPMENPLYFEAVAALADLRERLAPLLEL